MKTYTENEAMQILFMASLLSLLATPVDEPKLIKNGFAHFNSIVLYFKNDILHNEEGPAIICEEYHKIAYFLNGHYYTEENFNLWKLHHLLQQDLLKCHSLLKKNKI